MAGVILRPESTYFIYPWVSHPVVPDPTPHVFPRFGDDVSCTIWTEAVDSGEADKAMSVIVPSVLVVGDVIG